MAKEQKSSVAFEADISQFTASIAEMRSDIKLINAQFDASSSKLDDWSSSSEGLEQKIKSLNGVLKAEKQQLDDTRNIRDAYIATLDKNEKKLAELKRQYEAVVAAEGESSNNAKKLAKQIGQVEVAVNKNAKSIKYYSTELAKQETDVNKVEKELKKYEEALENVGKESEEASKKIKDASDSAGGFSKSMKGIGKGLAAGIVAIGAAAATAATSFLALAESTREFREDTARLNSAFEAAGYSAETTSETYKKLFGAIGESDTAVEAAQQIALLANSEEEVAKWADLATGVVATFGDALKPETFFEAANETLKLGEATGAFTQMLEGTGYSVDEFNKGLAAATTEEEKQAYMLEISNKLLGEAGDAYNKTAKDIIEAREAEANLTQAMADLGAVAEPIVTIFKNGFANVLRELTPLITEVAEGFKQLISGDIQGGLATFSDIFLSLREKANEAFLGMLNGATEIIPQLLPKIAEFLGQAVQNVVEFAPLLLDAALQLFGALIEALPPTLIALVEQLPTILTSISTALSAMIPSLLENATTFLMTIVEALPSVVQSLVEALPQLINTILEFISQNLPVIYEGFLNLLMQLIEALPSVITSIISELPKLITTIVKTIATNFPKLLATGIDLWLQLVKAIPQIIPKLLTGIGDIVSEIKGAFDADMLVDVGVNIVEGLWEGIESLKDWLKKKVEAIAGWLPDWVKEKLGIASPSKVFKEIGKFSADGLGVGFADEMKKVKKSIVNSVDMDDLGLNGNVSIGTSGGRTAMVGGAGRNVTLNYTVNSAKSLSRREMYLQAKKAKTLLGGVN